MKYILKFILILIAAQISFAQSQYELSFDVQKDGNDARLDYYIQKVSGPDFEIGASNFPLIKSNDFDLDWSSIQWNSNFIGPFDGNANAYDQPRIAVARFVNYTQLTKYNGSGSGFNVNSTKTQIASFKVPITGNCPEVMLQWETNWGAINEFATDGSIVSVKSGASFINPVNSHFMLYDVPGTPQIKQSDSLSTCEGKAAVLETSNSNFTTQWFKDGIELSGANDSVLLVYQTGLYKVQLSNCNIHNDSDPVYVDVIPNPVKSVISENNGILYSSVTNNLQWYHNGVAIPGATTESLIPSNSGIYTVKTINECGEILSDPYNYAPLGVDFAQNGPYLHVFPNPYVGKTNIEVTLEKETELTIEVYDLKGNLVNLVKEGFFDKGKHQLKFSAQELGYAAGTYVLKVRTNEKELIHNLVELK